MMRLIERKRRPDDRVSGYSADCEDCLDGNAYFSDDTLSGDPIHVLEHDLKHGANILEGSSPSQISSSIDLSSVKVSDASSTVTTTSYASSSTEQDFAMARYHSHVADMVQSCAHYYKNPRDDYVPVLANDDDVASAVLKPMPSASSLSAKRRCVEPFHLSIESIRVAAQMKDFADDAVIGLTSSARILIQVEKQYKVLHLNAGLLQFLTPPGRADQPRPPTSSFANFFSADSFLHLDNVMQSFLHDANFFDGADFREFHLASSPAGESEGRIGSFRRCSLQITPVNKAGSNGNKYFLIEVVEENEESVGRAKSGSAKKTDRDGSQSPISHDCKVGADPAHRTVG